MVILKLESHHHSSECPPPPPGCSTNPESNVPLYIGYIRGYSDIFHRVYAPKIWIKMCYGSSLTSFLNSQQKYPKFLLDKYKNLYTVRLFQFIASYTDMIGYEEELFITTYCLWSFQASSVKYDNQWHVLACSPFRNLGQIYFWDAFWLVQRR